MKISLVFSQNTAYSNNMCKILYLSFHQVAGTGDKFNHFEDQEQMIKKHSRKVEKMHADLESKILERHTEL